MKKLAAAAFFILFATPVLAEEFNAGFVQGLWYSTDQVFVDEPVRIYIAIRNNTGSDLTGTVEFRDGTRLIERNSVSALDNRLIESWADWTPTYGEHTISATLSKVTLHQVGTDTEKAEVVANATEDIIFVDYDTDKDGVGNETDEDDDGDGIKDKEDDEPLVFNESAEPEAAAETEDDTEAAAVEEPEPEDSSAGATAGPAGLERYLVDSRAENALSGVTNVINTTRRNLDTYRQNRGSEAEETAPAENTQTTEEKTSTSTATDGSSFGEIERSYEESGPGLIASIVSAVGTIIDKIYTLILFLFSLYLGHPVIVQLTLLALILLVVYKLARRIGRRPQ